MLVWLYAHVAHLLGGLGGIIATLITERGLRFVAQYKTRRNGHVVEHSVGIRIGGKRGTDEFVTPTETPKGKGHGT